jgi:hypothetical protein
MSFISELAPHNATGSWTAFLTVAASRLVPVLLVSPDDLSMIARTPLM